MTEATTTAVHERLLDASEKLLAEKGIRATTMQQVAETAGVSRAWLYRHFPDKPSIIGATIVRLSESFWRDARAELDAIDDFAGQLTAGVRIGRGAYDDPGTLLLRLRTEEPTEFAECAGVGVVKLIPDLADFWFPYVEAAAARGEIHPGHDLPEVAEWVARVLISLGTSPGETIDIDDAAQVRHHMDVFVVPGLNTDPRTSTDPTG
ncbi:TetR/AcrR family transcriptional regulator [Gordonia sp. zg691]|uniref:TetR/AcrR family transcriptional regulator n=1 Tax=Gordonia jinghuaiqii TaxID=2758710 RepID=A0A7D7R9K1_9ACTN|nr:TetR/AcrR family transcriptional regulator [Gordonia jinghuaiqii]MBD0861062.1 TetR/AcrR family transcriptional regulator [Gordonia jinghuaiqii]QMT00830.1 TetR/AcrR family transcriptional regulator [Gordonia jinghuaiqii]